MFEEQKEGENRPAENGSAEPEEAAPNDLDSLRAELEDAQKRAETYHASWQRAAADYQNYKRRVEQERQDTVLLANASLIINVLPLLDDLERALSTIDTHLAGLTWVDGIRLIYRKFQAVLEAAGVKEIKADRETFDPNYHEAVAFGDGEEGKVVSVVQKGYTLGNRVVRPAMVIVGQGKGEEELGGEDAGG